MKRSSLVCLAFALWGCKASHPAYGGPPRAVYSVYYLASEDGVNKTEVSETQFYDMVDAHECKAVSREGNSCVVSPQTYMALSLKTQ